MSSSAFIALFGSMKTLSKNGDGRSAGKTISNVDLIHNPPLSQTVAVGQIHHYDETEGREGIKRYGRTYIITI